MCSLYHLDSYKREYIELSRYKGESRGGFANLLHHPHGTGEAQTAIDKLRKDSIAEPVLQSDNGSSFIAMDFRIVLRENHLTQNIIRAHT